MPKVLAVSGIKNSGKTSLISRLIREFKSRDIKVATIKHDGHDFQPDIEGSDSFIHRESGAEAVAVFSKNRWMLIREEKNIDEKYFIEAFKDFDLIILEGFKYSSYPKIELVRSAVSSRPVSDPETVLAYVTDLDEIDIRKRQFRFDQLVELVDYISLVLDL